MPPKSAPTLICAIPRVATPLLDIAILRPQSYVMTTTIARLTLATARPEIVFSNLNPVPLRTSARSPVAT